MPAFTAVALLDAVGWQADEAERAWRADDHSVLAPVGLLPAHPSHKKQQPACASCNACGDPFDAILPGPISSSDSSLVLPSFDCGHPIHPECLSRLLSSCLSRGERLPFKCIQLENCPGLLQEEILLAHLAEAADRKMYANLRRSPYHLGDRFVACRKPSCRLLLCPSESIASSPAGGGGRAVGGTARLALCACGTAMCLACRLPPHEPLPCSLAREWDLLVSSASRLLHLGPLPEEEAKRLARLYGGYKVVPTEWEMREMLLAKSRLSEGPLSLTHKSALHKQHGLIFGPLEEAQAKLAADEEKGSAAPDSVTDATIATGATLSFATAIQAAEKLLELTEEAPSATGGDENDSASAAAGENGASSSKLCPKCFFAISRIEGCPSMKCPRPGCGQVRG